MSTVRNRLYGLGDCCLCAQSGIVYTVSVIVVCMHTTAAFPPASMVIFLSQTETNNGTLKNLRAICAEEGGLPLIIKTSTVRNQAVELLKSECKLLKFNKSLGF